MISMNRNRIDGIYVGEAASGTVVETLLFGVPTGTFYRIDRIDISGRVRAYKNYRGGLTHLHNSTKCRIVENADLEFMELRF